MRTVKDRFLRFAFSNRNPFYSFFAKPDQERAFPDFGENYPVCYEDRKLSGFLLRGKGGLIVVIHGGGYLFGHYLDEANYAAYLHEKTGMSVFSAYYDLSETAKFPTQIHQVFTAVKQLCIDPAIDTDELYLAGHSAGGNCAAAVALLAQQENEFMPSGIILNYPVLDFSEDPRRRPKVKGNSIPYMMMDAFDAFYFSEGTDRADPLASPLHASDGVLKSLPPVYIMTCAQDNLRIDGIQFYERLKDLNCPVCHVEYNQKHGFLEAGMNSEKTDTKKEEAENVTDAMLTWLKSIRNGGYT